MATAELARRYFEALNARDLDRAIGCWASGGVERIVGQEELTAPGGVRDYFGALFDAFPDWSFDIVDAITGRGRTAVRWRARATFAGPGHFQGFEPNGARIEIEGCDVLSIAEGRIERNEVYLDSAAVARQLGFMPPLGSPAQAALTNLANLRTRLGSLVRGSKPGRIADGVWIVRGGFPPRIMNVYLIEARGKVTVFDAGSSDMAAAIAAAAARLGGIERVVLGHADPDHRGAAPALGALVHCHPAERDAAQSESSTRHYWDFSKLGPHGKFALKRLMPVWDGGAVKIEASLGEGDEVAGFRVIELPGHAPGLIGLFRESDRLALVSDCIYTLDPQTGLSRAASVPHPAFNLDTAQARASIRKLGALRPAEVWAGHAHPVTGDVVSQLERAASA